MARQVAAVLQASSFALLVLLLVATRPERAASAPADEVARGLDVFVHASTQATARGTLPINVVALGFPTASSTRPLAGATVEATWDAESLSPKGAPKPAAAPPAARGTADAHGRATLELAVPDGPPAPLVLLVSVSHGGKQRVREITVERVAADRLDLFVSDTRVVPGSEVVAWTLVTDREGHAPLPGSRVEVRLRQGGVVRFRREFSTDAAGSAMVRVPIPRDQEPDVSWTLHARVLSDDPRVSTSSAETRLVPREETPGKPTLWASFDAGSVPAGTTGKLRVRLRDAADEGVASHAVFVWTGPRGTDPPADDAAFKKAALARTTDGAGELLVDVATPSTIPLRGTSLRAVVRTEVDGQPLRTETSVDVARRRGFVALTPEGTELVPGVEQELYLQVSDDKGDPVRGQFSIRGDGLAADVATDEHGEGSVTWKVPAGIGARRDTGPCPGSVAAALTLKPLDDRAAAAGALDAPLCVPVRREARILARPTKTIVRAGDKLAVDVVGAGKEPVSVILSSVEGARASAVWNAAGDPRVEIAVPDSLSGVVKISAARPRGDGATISGSAVLVLPKNVPA